MTVPLEGLKYGSGSEKSRAVFTTAFKELQRCQNLVQSGGNNDEARDAKEAIDYFVELLGANRMLDYLVSLKKR